MKKGLSSNSLKIIAIIIMLIDHVGMYMHGSFNKDTYYILRSIGRIAMPIFAYLIVQGFFYTKNLKSYIFRIFILATITQLSLLILGYINQAYYPNYGIGVNGYFGVLYSYTFSLILIAIIDKKKIIEKLSENQNLIIKLNIFMIIALIYLNFKIEYGLRVPFIMLEMYGIEKLFQNKDKILLKAQEKVEIKEKIKYLLLILISFAISLCFVNTTSNNKYAMLLSIIPIALYNGEKGRRNKFVQYLFYAIFPIQHVILYLLAMVK